MSKTFTYTVDTKAYCDDERDICMYDSEEIEYEVSDKDLKNAIIEFIKEGYDNLDEKSLEALISDFGLWETFEEAYEDVLKEKFYDDARHSCY